jgi:co-chaperonin GroES (HSP10)
MIPIGTNVLVKPYPSEEITDGGLFVPLSVRKDSNKVLVIKTGNGTAKKRMTVKEGMTAYRVLGWGTEVLINNEKHFLMDMGALLAIE